MSDTEPTKEFYTPKEVAKMLGRSYVTIYRWIKADKIPAVQLNGKRSSFLIPASWIEEVKYLGGAKSG